MKVHTTSFGLSRREDRPSEDAFEVRAWDETVIAVMADGAGGARAGGEASARIVKALVRDYAERPANWTPGKSLTEFTRLLNNRLYHDSLTRFGAPELVSTVAVAVVEGDRLFGLNVGDSRVYLSRGGQVRQLSTDHVLGGEHHSHVLSRAMGMANHVEPTLFEEQLADGDVAFLCTDGISNVLEGSLQTWLNRRSTARVIVAEAREQATPELLDDMSAIVVEVREIGQMKRLEEAALPIPHVLRRGDVIDGYTLTKPFQQSERVWLAESEGRRFTLKFAPIEAETSEAILHAFTREVWHALRLNSGFMPRAFVPPEATLRYYAMEFIEAPSLDSFLRSRRLAVDEAIRLGEFLLGAGQHLLQLDLVHGDLKPENILVSPSYDSLDFRLVDFGSVAEVFSVTSRAGTASYLAPERFHESPISERTEIFAIGVTLFRALTGTFPYGEIERFQTPRFRHAKSPIRLNPNLPPWLNAVLLRATAPTPEQRYQHYSEMLYDLQHPDKVRPFPQSGEPWVESGPLTFYRTGFWLLAGLCLFLLLKLVGPLSH
jgi:serine/threonine protein phosphatase PrpC